MKINVNGVTREMTPEEIAEWEKLQQENQAGQPTMEDLIKRIAALEQNAIGG